MKDNFKLEMTTEWSFPKRGNWATHSGMYRGNWSPYVPRNLILKFTSNMSTNASIMVEKGLGNALIIKGSLPFLDKNRIKCIPLYPALIANSVLVWKRHQPFNLATTKFIEYIQCFLSMK